MYDTYASFGYALFRAHTEKHNPVKEAVDFMLLHCKDARWDIVADSMKTLEEGFKMKKPCPYTEKLFDWIADEMQKQFERDMIYYTICYDGFRL